MIALFFLTTGRQQMMVAGGLAMSVLLLNAPSEGVMMLSGLLLSQITMCHRVGDSPVAAGLRTFMACI